MAAVVALLSASLAVALASCCKERGPNASLPDLFKLVADPLECTKVSLRKEVEIRRQVIFEPSVMKDSVILVYRYREGGEENAYDPKLLSGYNNVSLVIETKTETRIPIVVLRDFTVVEMWKFDAASKTKLCYLWTISKYNASFRLMLEDFSRTLLAERQVPLNDEQVRHLKAFHNRLLRAFLERVKSPAPKT